MIILGTNSIKETGFDVDNSLRFHSDTYLTNTFGSAPTLATKNTMSVWFKRSTLGTLQQLMTGNNNAFSIVINSNDTIAFYNSSGQLLSPKVYRDTSAWMHFVFAYDSTQGTDTNRFKVYINGVLETSFNNTAYPSQNAASDLGANGTDMKIGTRTNNDRIFEGYMAETAFVDGQALGADSFGEFDDSGIWKPIDISGLTFGNNGFYLEYKQFGTGTNSSGMGADTSGNDFHFAVTGFTATDQSTDTCTNNSCTMNPLNMPISNQPTFSEGNLKTVTSSSGSGRFGGTSTFGVTQGKWYVEAKATVGSTYSRNSIGVSYNPAEMARNNSDNTLTDTSYAWGWDSSGGDVYHDSSVVVNYATYTTGDICQIFLDLDNHKLYYGKNGTLQSSTGISLDTGETYFIAQIDRTGGSDTSTFEFNFGSPIYAISSSNTDGEYGNFEYSTTITGDGASKTFKALNSANLAEYG